MNSFDAKAVRFVFLDRDGVLNRKLPEGEYVCAWERFAWLPGACEAIARINRAGWKAILVTNQRSIALGLLTMERLSGIHAQMQRDLAAHGARLDAIYVCPHDRGKCHCRKPETGLFERALADFPGAGTANSIVIGDSLPDIEAGKRMGMKTIFIRGEAARQKAGAENAAALANAAADSLLEAVEGVLELPAERL